MRQVKYDYSNYDHKEELVTLVNSLNESFEKFTKSFDGRKFSLSRIESAIAKKKELLNKCNGKSNELSKRIAELESLKSNTNDEIKELDTKKSAISYEDSEVQKMEIEDITSAIEIKRSRISKIDEKIEFTKTCTKNNEVEIKRVEGEIKTLELEKRAREESLFRTEALLDLIKRTRENFGRDVEDILKSKYVELKVEEEKEPEVEISFDEEPKVEITFGEEPKSEYTVTDYEISEMKNAPLEEEIIMEEPIQEKTPIVEEKKETPNIVITDEEDDISDTEELSILDFDKIELPEDAFPVQRVKNNNEEKDMKQIVEETFKKEGINYEDFSEESQIKLVTNADRVLKNIIVLKKHMIPLELTTNQSGIYYNMEPQDLDDLLDIITTSEDGNGMGFTIDYTFYILEELSKIDIDKLIATYNNEFMNINSKSGLINLLKLTDEKIGNFENNKNANLDILKSLGIKTSSKIADEYPEFIGLDNPLFLNALNIFDKDDLVEKMNSDIKIVPKIMEYWKAN